MGDTVVFAYRIVQSTPMFPGHFSVAQVFSRYVAYDDVSIAVSAPTGLWAQYEAPHLTALPVRESGGRKTWEWTFRNPEPLKWTPEQAGIFTVAEQPGLYFSTFKSYGELVEAYGARARPKATVTERIRKLAEEVAGSEKSQKGQARALYDWIVRNITYTGNCIGVGAVVPHDMDAVLADGRRTPIAPHEANTQHMVTRYTIAADGSASGETKVTLGGYFAADARSRFRYLSKDDEEQFVKAVLSALGQSPTGSISREDATALVDNYTYSVKFSVQEFMPTDGSGGLPVQPAFVSPDAVGNYAQSAKAVESTRDQRCWGGHTTEEYTYEFPKNVKILSVPKEVEAKSDLLAYRATYRLEGNVLTVKRVVDDTTPTNTCTAEGTGFLKLRALS